MTGECAEMSAEFPCHQCGYDLRAQPGDGKCPECGEPVAESRRVAMFPRRPVWRKSDPRWRWRMLVGVWLLAMLPLMDVLEATGWDAWLPVPGLFSQWDRTRTLSQTLFSYRSICQPILFCVGMVLLFSTERGRRRNWFDWTRRWGVLCCYVVALLSAAMALFLCAVVLAGIASIFQTMPLKYQPPITPLFVKLSAGYLTYGAYPKEIAVAVLVVFSSLAVLLACAPLFDAISSCGPKRLAIIVLFPLAFFSVMYIWQAGCYCAGVSSTTWTNLFRRGVYFWPDLLVWTIEGRPDRVSTYGMSTYGMGRDAFLAEVLKWCIVFGIAVWLSVAQVLAWWKREKPRGER